LEYDRSSISEERLKQYEREEMAAGTTLVGPHRDDFVFRIMNNEPGTMGSRDLAVYGSRGEQRLAVLWLKLGELKFMTMKMGEFSSSAKASEDKPVLLLDDIFSELDDYHRQMVLKVTGGQQTIITTADLELKKEEWLSGVNEIEL
jgi:DNA replication and repair protein RecF